jgi:hypothetical protein
LTVLRSLSAVALLGLIALVACNNAPTEPPPGGFVFTPAEARVKALNLWRDDDRDRHPKGSCSGCHGADFYDLARIGSTQNDILRRAKIDGASPEESAALAQAIMQIRAQDKLPAQNPRNFRPFQPGGSVLPGATPLERDINFGQSLEGVLPTLMGARIDSLAAAKKAKAELLDLVNGENASGTNPQRLNLRSLPTGIRYPLWSADLAQGENEGTLNDWLADIASDAKPEFKVQWYALQDAYLADSSDENFWKMYAAVDGMTATKPFERCAVTDINPTLACGAVDDFARHKLRSAMIGQHLMRVQQAGREGFARGALAFSYLDNTGFIDHKAILPGVDMWEIGDRARTMLDENQTPGSLRVTLEKLGLPKFVRESVSGNATVSREQQDLRLTWFWIGFTFDPSFARISGSNSTKVGEYMVGSLIDEDMHLHNAFSQHVRLVAKGFLKEANVTGSANKLVPVTPAFLMNYSYFIGYGRPVIQWHDSRLNRFPQAQKDQQEALWERFTGNGFRMSLYLQMEALDTADSASRTKLLDALYPVDSTTGQRVEKWGGGPLKRFFDCYERRINAYTPEERGADYDLLNALNTKIGNPTQYDSSAALTTDPCL